MSWYLFWVPGLDEPVKVALNLRDFEVVMATFKVLAYKNLGLV